MKVNTQAMLELIAMAETEAQVELLDDMYRALLDLDPDCSNLELAQYDKHEGVNEVQLAVANKLLALMDLKDDLKELDKYSF